MKKLLVALTLLTIAACVRVQVTELSPARTPTDPDSIKVVYALPSERECDELAALDFVSNAEDPGHWDRKVDWDYITAKLLNKAAKVGANVMVLVARDVDMDADWGAVIRAHGIAAYCEPNQEGRN